MPMARTIAQDLVPVQPLGPPTETIRGRFDQIGNNTGCFRYANHTFIMTHNRVHPQWLNYIQHGQYNEFGFWWSPNFEVYETESERTTGLFAVETYIGPIESFQQEYQTKRRSRNNNRFYTTMPVIRQIICNGTRFFNDDIRFSHDFMEVEIQYKKFLI